MIIHKSHSKNEICKMIKLLKIDIVNPKQYKKVELSVRFLETLKYLDNIEPSIELPFTNVIELKHYLSNPNPNKLLPIREKNRIIHLCKKIKHFCRNNYRIEATTYRDIQELYKEADYIRLYGIIPSVRKCIRDLNQYPNRPRELRVVVPLHVQRELEIKQKLKDRGYFYFKVQHGKYSVSFD